MKPFNKNELESCKTMGDAFDFFRNIETSGIQNFIKALENAKEYVDITMRDESFLGYAKAELRYRL
jgi:hypothetical protein